MFDAIRDDDVPAIFEIDADPVDLNDELASPPKEITHRCIESATSTFCNLSSMNGGRGRVL